MRVIGSVNDRNYVVVISHEEIEKVMDKYYGKIERIKVGDEIDLGAGYNFANDIRRSCKSMTEAMKQFDEAHTTMRSFAKLISDLKIAEGESK